MKDKKEEFDYESFKQQAREKLLGGGDLLGSDGALTPLLKDFLEESLLSELDEHLDQQVKESNRKNGRGKKKVKTSLGKMAWRPLQRSAV
ncbi:hypothetical protein AB9P05_08650 [Roseivirga sp. BDSF3-8]|uniref:hypothetical protein n=1 Tax=Roseivirga sp. BDSF3-8 TaxID=3241598 RepID=UPI0035322352